MIKLWINRTWHPIEVCLCPISISTNGLHHERTRGLLNLQGQSARNPENMIKIILISWRAGLNSYRQNSVKANVSTATLICQSQMKDAQKRIKKKKWNKWPGSNVGYSGDSIGSQTKHIIMMHFLSKRIAFILERLFLVYLALLRPWLK